ncbi:MAG: HD-GYP domain-containing protein, partial [Alphaproteobacteria bacterium]|nr:HD-GYP domain-containing protein [Alphaproteobacteria bacterium]
LGWFEGVYRLAPESVDAIRADIARITALVVGAVLLTALALHPVMASLQKNVLATAHDLLRANIDTLQVLGGAIAKRDSDTSAHNFRVTIYAVRIGEAMGLDDGAIRRVIKGSFLHDVGKIAIRDSILLKPGKLTAEEFAEMRTHVAHGLDIIAANTWLRDAREIVGGHHEKVDGTGYPLGLAGDDIPLAARIFAVADVFDALTSQRPYKAAMPDEEALTILEEGRGKHFDTAVLDAFGGILADIRAELSSAGDVEMLADRILARYFTV